ncbi:hypothetical protein DMW99_21630 [Pseudomonas chlororaphis]|nr:oxidoreductase [Pseudomonas sp. FW306-2-2C-D06C]PYC33050.1 hypothetical protein DMW99_21630 [Pseudomonas chlororaphis]
MIARHILAARALPRSRMLPGATKTRTFLITSASKGIGRALANQTVKHVTWRELPWAGSVSRMNTHCAMAEGSTIKVHRIYASQGYITL